ncbi:Drebrins and related actin binding proteins [Ceraceosorus bombacis]|uniref:Drebrins and related actin binding proteins n=1 Tax=Ceraceosorus bombacis TaxID=401625 RepID=A0A0P1BE44_9BASI|nr:Drebrins and related actin binding proteins [Ceraceosorus bombacis]
MSLGVNLSAPGIKSAYDAVLSGSKDYLILSYERGSNDIKVDTLASGSLDDALFDFSDGSIMYGLIRVVDPNSNLPKYVLINWCGEGVPVNRKGLFPSHSADVAKFLRGYHVSVNARTEADLDAKAIMKKVADSGGSKYSAAGDAANTQRGGRIEPVGTAYTSRKDDLANIRANAAATASAPPPAPRPAVAQPHTPAAPAAPAAPPAPAAPATSTGGFGAPKVGGIIGSVPPAPAQQPAATIVRSAAPEAPAKPAAEDRIGPVGTAYEPVRIGKPGKLGANRWNPGANASSSPSTPAAAGGPAPRAPSGGLTWSQRQEAAKKEREEEEARSPAPPAPPSAEPDVAQLAKQVDDTKLAPQTAEALAAPASGAAGLRAVAVYDYDATEENEISFREGDTITSIQQPDEGWWSGVAPDGSEGLFPATYVEVIEGESAIDGAAGEEAAPPPPPPPPAPPAPPAAPAAPPVAAEEVPEGETIVGIVFESEEWWSGTSSTTGQAGLFPANYVELHE